MDMSSHRTTISKCIASLHDDEGALTLKLQLAPGRVVTLYWWKKFTNPPAINFQDDKYSGFLPTGKPRPPPGFADDGYAAFAALHPNFRKPEEFDDWAKTAADAMRTLSNLQREAQTWPIKFGPPATHTRHSSPKRDD
jgi:hypothetical protein